MNAVFFDLDGTLFDTKADLAATVNHTRRDLGLQERPEEEIILSVGRGAKYLLEHAIPEVLADGFSCASLTSGQETASTLGQETASTLRHKTASTLGQETASTLGQKTASPRFESVMEKFMSHYAEHCVERVQPYPGVVRTLGELQDRGWLMGVNTNKPNFAVRLILEKFGFTRYFGSAVVAGGDGIPLKPDAQSLRECASRLRGHRLSSHDWMVGDNWTDMQCAANAGVKSAFCAFGFGRLNESRYTARISRFDELLRHLKPEE